jgi:hypothetical protein
MNQFIHTLNLLLVLFSSALPVTICSNSTGGHFVMDVIGASNSSAINASGLNFSLLGTNTDFNLVLLPKLSPGNTTSTSDSSSGLDWWEWALIAGAGVILIIMLILIAVFYADFAGIKKYMGYEKVGARIDNTVRNQKVIEVELVQPCAPYV